MLPISEQGDVSCSTQQQVRVQKEHESTVFKVRHVYFKVCILKILKTVQVQGIHQMSPMEGMDCESGSSYRYDNESDLYDSDIVLIQTYSRRKRCVWTKFNSM